MHLSLKNLSKSFNRKSVLKNLNLEVEPKRTIGIVGENGSGKTTLLKIISGFINPDNGRGSLDKFNLFTSDYSYLKYILFWGHYQDCYSNFTAYENLKLFLQLRDEFQNEEMIINVLKEVGLESASNNPMIEFSAGMIQRYHIARMKLSNWEILILDEPTNALDKRGLALLEDTLVKYKKSKSIILSSHNHDFLFKYSDIVYSLLNGELKEYKFN